MEFVLATAEFEALRKLVYERTGIKLADSKRQMLQSRLARRLRALQLKTFQEYYVWLVNLEQTDPELTEFINAVTTNKTDFYREAHHFQFMTRQVMPELANKYGRVGKQLKVWHAGCSTGEEPYTLSVALHEAVEADPGWVIKQIATDIDTSVLEHAQRGEYEMERLAPVPHSLCKKYFLRGTGSKAQVAKVKRCLGEWITFRQLNLLDNPWPFAASQKFDVIFCRNVMIYFDKATQRRLVQRYWNLLPPGGYLLIGHSESLFGVNDDFENVGNTIYRRPVKVAEVA